MRKLLSNKAVKRAAIASLPVALLAAGTSHASDNDDECDDDKKNSEDDEDACALTADPGLGLWKAVGGFVPLLFMPHTAEATPEAPAPTPPAPENPLDQLSLWVNDTGFPGVEGVIGLADTNADGTIDQYLLTTHDTIYKGVQMYSWEWADGIGRDTLVANGDISGDDVYDSGGHDGTYWWTNFVGEGASTGNGGTSWADQLIRTVSVPSDQFSNLAGLGPSYVYVSGPSFFHTGSGPATVTNPQETPEQNGVDNWGFADIDANGTAEFWHWDGSNDKFYIFDVTDSWDLTFNSPLTDEVNATFNELAFINNVTKGDIKQAYLWDFDGDGDVDLSIAGGLPSGEVAIYELFT